MKHLVAIIVVLAAILSAQAQPRHDRQHPMPGTVGVTPAPLNCVLGTFSGLGWSTAL
jgi:hypothetical protein